MNSGQKMLLGLPTSDRVTENKNHFVTRCYYTVKDSDILQAQFCLPDTITRMYQSAIQLRLLYSSGILHVSTQSYHLQVACLQTTFK